MSARRRRSPDSAADRDSTARSPFLTDVTIREDRVDPSRFPFNIPLVAQGIDLRFTAPVTFLVGENGSGKSTRLEAIAWNAGFSGEGGNRTNSHSDTDDGAVLGAALSLGWRRKVDNGFFMRAETFFNFSSYLESVNSTFRAYGGVPLHAQSHGEAFLALFNNRFESGLYILDEPEAALSPQRQLAFLTILHDLTRTGGAQFIIATHSPILLPFPGATVWSLDGGKVSVVDYRDTEHFQLTKSFLDAPERYFRHLFGDTGE